MCIFPLSKPNGKFGLIWILRITLNMKTQGKRSSSNKLGFIYICEELNTTAHTRLSNSKDCKIERKYF
jgi:hypothetical protein